MSPEEVPFIRKEDRWSEQEMEPYVKGDPAMKHQDHGALGKYAVAMFPQTVSLSSHMEKVIPETGLSNSYFDGSNSLVLTYFRTYGFEACKKLIREIHWKPLPYEKYFESYVEGRTARTKRNEIKIDQFNEVVKNFSEKIAGNGLDKLKEEEFRAFFETIAKIIQPDRNIGGLLGS